MTRDEAIVGLHRILENYYRVCNEHLLKEIEVAEEINSLNMAIEALSKIDAKENYWTGCESCDRAMEDGECELWGDRMTEECGAWKERKNDKERSD